MTAVSMEASLTQKMASRTCQWLARCAPGFAFTAHGAMLAIGAMTEAERRAASRALASLRSVGVLGYGPTRGAGERSKSYILLFCPPTASPTPAPSVAAVPAEPFDVSCYIPPRPMQAGDVALVVALLVVEAGVVTVQQIRTGLMVLWHVPQQHQDAVASHSNYTNGQRILGALVAAGQLVQVGEGRYAVTASGLWAMERIALGTGGFAELLDTFQGRLKQSSVRDTFRSVYSNILAAHETKKRRED